MGRNATVLKVSFDLQIKHHPVPWVPTLLSVTTGLKNADMCAEEGSTLRWHGLKCRFQSVKYNVLPSSALSLPAKKSEQSRDHLLLPPGVFPALFPFCTCSHGPSWAGLLPVGPFPAPQSSWFEGAGSVRAHQICHRPAYPTDEGPGAEAALVKVFPVPVTKGLESQGGPVSPWSTPHREEVQGLWCPQRAERCISALSISASSEGDETKHSPEIMPNKAQGKWEHTARRWKAHYNKFGLLFFFKI